MIDQIVECIISRPQEFTLAGRVMRLYPESLGKSIVMASYIAKLDVGSGIMSTVEALALCRSQREEVCDIIALGAAETKAEIFNIRALKSRSKFLKKNLDDDEMASLLLAVLSSPRIEDITKSAGITEEHERRSRAAKVNGGNSVSFGGKTLFGSLIDVACERYGWTYDYVVWGIPLLCLRLMLADSITTMYMNEEDRKKAHLIDRSEDFYSAETTDINVLRNLTQG